MKLKEAVKAAQWINTSQSMPAITYIAADADGGIWAYVCEPYIHGYEDRWKCDVLPFSFLGMYTGRKHWTYTRRKVRKEEE